MDFVIFTDTSANLPSAYLKENGIPVIPFTYTVNGEDKTCLDTDAFEDGEGERYYAAIKDGMRVMTSQIAPGTYAEYWEPYLKEGRDLLYIGMSSGISSSYSSAEAAAAELRAAYPERTIRTVDTLAASLGEGMAVIRAAECRKKGMTIDETADLLIEKRRSLYQTVLIEDLMHLHKGGRISAPKALLGTVLGIRPILKGDEGGHLVVCGKTRGRRRGLAALAEKYEKLFDRGSEQPVCIAYTDCPEDAYALRDMLSAIAEPKDHIIVRYEPVTGSYVGPGTVALFFEGRDGVRAE